VGAVSTGTIDEPAAVLTRCAVVAGLGEWGRGTSCGSNPLALDELTPLPTTAKCLAWSSSASLFARRTTTGERCADETGRSVRGWNTEPAVAGTPVGTCMVYGVGMYASETGEDDSSWGSCMYWTGLFVLRPKRLRSGFSTPLTHDLRTSGFRRRRMKTTRATRTTKPCKNVGGAT